VFLNDFFYFFFTDPPQTIKNVCVLLKFSGHVITRRYSNHPNLRIDLGPGILVQNAKNSFIVEATHGGAHQGKWVEESEIGNG
jgi:hypothetical protein